MKRNESFFFALLAAVGALLIAFMLLIGAWCNLHDARSEIAEQQKIIAELKARPLTVQLIREDPEPEPEPEPGPCLDVDKPAWHDAGEFRIYHYCPCEYCCSKSDGITATGTLATEGRTVAVDPDVIPLGSEVEINGVIYIAEDTGVHGQTIDLFINSHSQAVAMGTYLTNVKWR